MITLIGIILLLLSIATLVMKPFLHREDVVQQSLGRNNQMINKLVARKSPDFLLNFTWKKSLGIFLIGLFVLAIPGAFFYAQPGKAYAVQYLWGTAKPVMSQGIKTKWWGRLIDISHQISIKDVLPETEIKQESEYTYIVKSTEREFNDAVKGDVANTVVISINIEHESKFLKVATDNRSERNLVYSRIIPFRDAVLKNTAKLMSAQDYIAGASAEFDRAFADQLENGMYELEEVSNHQDADTIGKLGKTRTVNDNSNGERKKYKIKYAKNSQGVLEPVRTGESLRDVYGLKVILAVVNKIDWEDKFDERLDKQKEQVAATQLEKQMAEKAVYNRKRLYEEGEANKAGEQARLEKLQIEKTITAETNAKVAIFALTESKTLFDKAVIDAKSKKVAADAQAYENQKLVSAGLTPQEKMKWTFDIQNAVSKNLANTKWPEVFINQAGGEGKKGQANETSILYDLLGAEVAKQMVPRVKTSD